MDNNARILHFLGIANRAGKTAAGEEACRRARKYGGKLFLVIVAHDAGENTREHVARWCRENSIPLFTFGTREQLGRFTGRGEVSTAGITDEGFSRRLSEMLTGVD